MKRIIWLGTIILILCLEDVSCGKKKKKDTDAVYECFMKDLCKNSNVGAWVPCWDKLKYVTQKWMLDGVRACSFSLREGILFGELVDTVCGFPEDKWKPCYEILNSDFKGYVNEVNADLSEEKKEESKAIEDGRICLGSNMMACSSGLGR